MTKLSFEDMIRDAIVEKFFEPRLIQSGTTWDTHMQVQIPVYSDAPAPAALVAQGIFAAKQSEITKAIADRVDLDAVVSALAEKVTAAFVKEFMETNTNSWNHHRERYLPSQDSLRDRVRELVSEKLAERALAKIDEAAAALDSVGA